MVAQTIQHQGADTKRVSVTSVRKKDTWPKFVNQRNHPLIPTKWVEEEEEVRIYVVGNNSHPPFTVEFRINEKAVTFEIDTGAAVTILSQEVYRQLFPSLKLQPSSMLLKSYQYWRPS